MNWDVGAYVVQYFGPCVVIGAILPAAGAIISGMLRAVLRAVGYLDTD